MGAYSYSGENDRSLGLTGMALTIVALDGEKYFSHLDLDAPAGEGFGFSHEFTFSGNPRLSAKITWSELLRQLRMSASLSLGNVFCRGYVGQRRRPDNGSLESLKGLTRELSREECQLDSDEADAIFDQAAAYANRLFGSPQVQRIALTFSNELSRRRTLSATETLELLRALGAF